MTGVTIKIDELLGPARCLIDGGLPQYAGCLRHNIGDGPNKNFAPIARLRRLTATSLLQMNINQFEHQVVIMDSVRTFVEEEDMKVENKRLEEERAAAGEEKGDDFDGGDSLGWTKSTAGGASRGGGSAQSRGGSSRGSSRKENDAVTQRGSWARDYRRSFSLAMTSHSPRHAHRCLGLVFALSQRSVTCSGPASPAPRVATTWTTFGAGRARMRWRCRWRRRPRPCTQAMPSPCRGSTLS
jgi:hypothetical protein